MKGGLGLILPFLFPSPMHLQVDKISSEVLKRVLPAAVKI
jgi:hypothetical protein